MASPVAAIPAQYAKFLTALGADLVAYLGIYGATWHLQPALVMLGGALAVLGVPNASAPAPAPELVLPPGTTMTPLGPVGPVDPATGRTPSA